MVETNAPSSFIPQDTGVPYASRRRESGGLNELLLLCAIVLLIASIALGAGVFVYQQYLTQESVSKLAQIERAKESFDPALIHELTRLDDRMKASERILSAHLAPTAFFAALQQATLKTVSFSTLNFEVPDPGHVSIRMAGLAQSVNSIALQADIFSKSGIITGPIFSNIARDKDGVHFDLAASVNSAFLNYTSLVSGVPGGVPSNNQPASAPAEQSPFGAPANPVPVNNPPVASPPQNQ